MVSRRLLLVVVCMLTADTEYLLLEQDTYYKRLDLAPSTATLMYVVPDVPHMPSCLLTCSDTPGCVSVVYNKTDCQLHNSTVGVIEYTLSTTLKAVAMVSRTELRDTCARISCQNSGICMNHISPPYYQCQCIPPCSGPLCMQCYDIPALSSPEQDGWTVMLRRQDGSVNFDRLLAEYQAGFGDPRGEFWLGLEAMHNLTSSGAYRVRFDIVDYSGTWAYAEYDSLTIGSEATNYTWILGDYSGNATSGPVTSNNFNQNSKSFVTKDSGDVYKCAEKNSGGGWWYSRCGYARLTGLYGNEAGPLRNIPWSSAYTLLAYADMKVKLHG